MSVELRSENTLITGETFNISKGGLYILTNETVKLKVTFNIILQFREGESVHCVGTAVWINTKHYEIPAGLGIKFSSISHHAKQAIMSYVQEQKRIIKDHHVEGPA